MKQLYSVMQQALARGENVVLVRIVASSGSVPRGVGACMAVFEDGSTLGTIGGGAVEKIAAEHAMGVHQKKESACKGFCLAPNQVADIGMICGGDVTVYYQFFGAGDQKVHDYLLAMLQALSGGKNCWRITRLEGETVTGEGLYDAENGLRFLEDLPVSQLQPMLTSKSVYVQGTPAYSVEPICRAGFVYIFGGGHVGRELVPVLSRVGFRVCVYDDRESFAKPENYPQAEKVIFGSFLNIREKIEITKDDYVVIMTPGHLADREVLLQALRTDAAYIGCIGSKKKVAKTNEYLLANGIPEAALSRVHAPIGIEIFGETPAEIAISVAAEMICHRAILSGADHH